MQTAIILLALAAGSGEPAAAEPACVGEGPEAEAVCAVLAEQQAAWNAGDIPGFMQGYWNDPALTFASDGAVTRGWTPTLERYLARYGDREAMGELTFSDVEVSMLGTDSALAFGRWRLERSEDAPGGLFTLVFRRFGDEWRVVHDHTSSGG